MCFQVSAVTSSLVDCAPVTAMMVKVVVTLAENESLNVPIQPLVWAVAFGPCLGGECVCVCDKHRPLSKWIFLHYFHHLFARFKGNGSLYGASANIICAGIAEQHGYKIKFSEFFK